VKYSSAKIFTIVFGALYTLAFYVDISLFRYYPEVGQFHLQMTPDIGPPILWYGWLAVAGLGSAAIAMLVPEKWADRLWPGWVWILPVIVVVVILVYESKLWFV
jgi:hypothetical protein